MKPFRLAAALFLLPLTPAAVAQADLTRARTVSYHALDIVTVHLKLKFTTLIQLPANEKILEATTGDKDFWVIDATGNLCFVHPAREGLQTNLNLLTDKGNIYSFILEEGGVPDLKLIVTPADPSNIVASNGPSQYVPASELAQARSEIVAMQSQQQATEDAYKSNYQAQLKFDYKFKTGARPFDITNIYHDNKFTYIQTTAREKFSVYEMRDGKPNLINYDLRNGTYIIPKVMDNGYVELGKKKLQFSRKG